MLKRANLHEHRDLVFEWRNTEAARKASPDDKKITFSRHHVWWKTNWRSVYIYFIDDKPMGYVRFNHRGVWSIFIAVQGQGLGKDMARLGIAKAKELGMKRILADVLICNERARRLHEWAGFIEVKRSNECLRLRLDLTP